MIKKEKTDEKFLIPSSIFQDRNLSPLESVSEYLKEDLDMSYHEIALLVNRDDRTIWTCYNRAKKKREKTGTARIKVKEKEMIPVDVFHNRDLAPLEGISKYLKEMQNLSYHEIAVRLNRDDRTIWTCYNRAQKKLRVTGSAVAK